MSFLLFWSFIAILLLSQCSSRDMIEGTSSNTQLIWRQKANYMPIPFKKRVKEVFFSDPGHTIFKGIVARDLEYSEGSAVITAGGVGSSYVNIRLKSARSQGLNYQIEIEITKNLQNFSKL